MVPWGVQREIQLAQKDGIDWILHIDTDELIYPGGASHFSLQQMLADVPQDVDTLVFPNYESLAERNDVSSPFEEVGTPLMDGGTSIIWFQFHVPVFLHHRFF